MDFLKVSHGSGGGGQKGPLFVQSVTYIPK